MGIFHLSAADYLLVGATAVFLVGGIGFSGWLRILKETNKLLKEQNVELKSENDTWKAKHEENVKAIASMQGQIDVLKSIPLVNIDTTLKQIASFNKDLAESNALILKSLQKSATSLSDSTRDTAAAVKQVKDDLSNSK